MQIVVDLVIVGIFALCIFLSIRRGFMSCILNLISFILAFVLAITLYKPVSNMIIDNTKLDENLHDSIVKVLDKKESEEEKDKSKEKTKNDANSEANVDTENSSEEIIDEAENVENTETTNDISENSSSTNVEKENKENKEKDNIEEDKEDKSFSKDISNYINKELAGKVGEEKTKAIDAIATNISVIIIRLLCGIAIFILASILLILVKIFAKFLTKLPGIHQADKLGGAIYGFIEAILIVWIALAIINVISPAIDNTELLDAINKSFIGGFLNNNNLLTKIIFK